MRFSLKWLHEWIEIPDSPQGIATKLAMAGFEVDKIQPAASAFEDVVVGKVTGIKSLKKGYLAEVDIGKSTYQMFAGKEIEPGHYVVAPIGAFIPSVGRIEPQEKEGHHIEGLICDPDMLGMENWSNEWVQCPPGQVLGTPIWEIFDLDDTVFELDVTPNRGDCLSIIGIARELSVLYRIPLKKQPINAVNTQMGHAYEIDIQAPEACPRFCTRLITNVDNQVTTPIWIQERLRRSGVRVINPIVDITNYVMLELGQPMHAYDAKKLKGGLKVRFSESDERLMLLDEKEVKLKEKTLLITDESGPIAIAGVMGGLATSVDVNTDSVVLESAFFRPECISGVARSYGIATDASHRFERGVDAHLPQKALERFTALLIEVTGGECGPVEISLEPEYIPQPLLVPFRKSRLEELLGFDLPEKTVIDIFERLGFTVLKKSQGWEIRVPTNRFDIEQEIDLIEEVARIHGYEHIPATRADMPMLPPARSIDVDGKMEHFLRGQGYHEAITYSFNDSNILDSTHPDRVPIKLLNPLTQDLNEMQPSLWPGLLQTLQFNQHRQQKRIRLYEKGMVFHKIEGEVIQEPMLAAVVTGPRMPEKWANTREVTDFFDVKNDVENLLSLALPLSDFRFAEASRALLHPGQCAEIYLAEEVIGCLGSVHPAKLKQLDIEGPVFLFEFALKYIQKEYINAYQSMSKYPSVRRDISFFVDKKISIQAIKDTISNINCEFLKEVAIFDVYEGKQVEAGKKSVALGLTLQHLSRTLVENEINDFIEQVVTDLKKNCQMQLRDA